MGEEEAAHRGEPGGEDQRRVGGEETGKRRQQQLRRVAEADFADIGGDDRREHRQRDRIGLGIGEAERHAGRQRPARADGLRRRALARRHRARAEIDEIEPAAGAEQFEQGRPEPVGAENRGDREAAPCYVADEMAADEPRARAPPLGGGEAEQGEEGRPRRDDIEIGGERGRQPDLRFEHGASSCDSRLSS